MARGKRDEEYFNVFVRAVEYSSAASRLMQDMLSDYHPEQIEERMHSVHKIEQLADDEKHEMMRMLAKEFITPIVREDILELAHELDEVTDHIDETMTSFYMFHVAKPRPEALTFADTIFDCCTAMHKAIVEFKHFRKSSTLHEDIVSIHTMREQADALYTKAIHNLYSGSADPIEVIVWTEIFGRFERCSKSCEEVAKVVESVIMKNS